jgi:preprotein translocase subunit SecG
MFTLIITLIVIVSLLLILVVLAQSSKGGVGSEFGGGASQVIGVKKTTDFLEKLTWGLAITLMILTVSTKFMISDPLQDAGLNSPNIERARQQTTLPSLDGGPGSIPSTNEQNMQDIQQMVQEALEEAGVENQEEEN